MLFPDLIFALMLLGSGALACAQIYACAIEKEMSQPTSNTLEDEEREADKALEAMDPQFAHLLKDQS